MARTPEQRGPFGRWLVSERKARGWTADEMRSRVQEARGFAMAHSTYALLESGQRQPTEEQRAHLTAFLGSEPHESGKEREDDPDLAGLLARLDAQARTIDTLAASITQLARAVAALTGTVLPEDELAQAVESAALVRGRMESGAAPEDGPRVVPLDGTRRQPDR